MAAALLLHDTATPQYGVQYSGKVLEAINNGRLRQQIKPWSWE